MRQTLNLGRPTAIVCVAALALAGSVFVGGAAAATGERPAVEWGGVTHTNRDSLEAWLTARGLSYRVWAYQHPIAALRLEQAAERAERARVAVTPRAEAAREQRPSTPMLAGLVSLGLVLGAVAVALSPASVRFNPAFRFASGRRSYLALASAACVAAAAASYAVQV